MSMRSYRHLPWMFSSLLLLGLVAAVAGAGVAPVLRRPVIDTVAVAILVVVPCAVAAAFLLLSWRVRTVVDDLGITQHWITRSYRIPFDEITGMEPVFSFSRWFLRVRCGERTFEVVPCQMMIWRPLSETLGPPRAMRAAWADIERRLGAPVG